MCPAMAPAPPSTPGPFRLLVARYQGTWGWTLGSGHLQAALDTYGQNGRPK
jgi:hypothetical protein